MYDDDLFTMLAQRDAALGAVLKKPRLSFEDARRVNAALGEIQRDAAARSIPALAARAAIMRRMLAAPSARALAKRHEQGVTFNDWDAQQGLWPNGTTSLVLQGARDKQPFVYMGFAWNGPAGVGVSSLKLSTFDSVDTSNFTTALAGASQVYDLALCRPDSNLWLTAKSKPNFQTIPFGTIVGGTQNVTISVINSGAPVVATLTVLKWTPNPGCRPAMVNFSTEVRPTDPAYRRIIGDIWSDPVERARVLNAVRAVGGYDGDDDEYEAEFE